MSDLLDISSRILKSVEYQLYYNKIKREQISEFILEHALLHIRTPPPYPEEIIARITWYSKSPPSEEELDLCSQIEGFVLEMLCGGGRDGNGET